MDVFPRLQSAFIQKKNFVGTTQSLRPENEKKEAKLPPLSQVWGEWRGENPLDGYKSSCLLLKFLSAKTLDLFVPGDIFWKGILPCDASLNHLFSAV